MYIKRKLKFTSLPLIHWQSSYRGQGDSAPLTF